MSYSERYRIYRSPRGLTSREISRRIRVDSETTSANLTGKVKNNHVVEQRLGNGVYYFLRFFLVGHAGSLVIIRSLANFNLHKNPYTLRFGVLLHVLDAGRVIDMRDGRDSQVILRRRHAAPY